MSIPLRIFLTIFFCLFLVSAPDAAHGQLFKSLFGGSKEKQENNQAQQNRQNNNQSQRNRANNTQRQQNAANAGQRPVQSNNAKPQQENAKPAEPQVVLENAPAEQRARFGQLIGANWIWSPAHTKDEVPPGDVYFRKTIEIEKPEFAQVHLCADNKYELFVNGRAVGSGADWRKMDVHDVVKLLKPGRNVIAVKVFNTDEGAAGLVSRVLAKRAGSTIESFSSDDTWRTSVKAFQNWNSPNFNDSEWLPAQVLGKLGATLPWGDEVVIAAEGARFVVDPEFEIERMTTDDQTGSLVAMTFNGDGNILASQEGGPLLLVSDKDRDGKFESVSVFSDQINTAQGILSLGQRVFAVGNGPQGSGLYRLTDNNRDGQADDIAVLLKFRGSAGEHGPHAVRFGPDGLLYVMLGNFARVTAQPSPRSPFTVTYEGDLITPRYEDPRGHAVGVPAPGGTVIRTDTQGSFVEVLAAGFRNAYDFAFNEDGELFTFDADMEWDMGTPWYRPTRINHVPEGAELGWRSGWAKWPAYYLDSLPAILPLGGGSPTGVEFYDHVMYPIRLQKTLFVGDWARGLIHAVKLEPDGSGYKAKSDVFLKGRPLNVTDLAIGPDGALYFATGGRGTDGGIYRVGWKGSVPPEVTSLGVGIERALRQPQLESDWARSRILAVKRQMGDRWATELTQVVTSPDRSLSERKRAVDLLSFFGPPLTSEMLIALSQDQEHLLRAKAARMMGLRGGTEFDQPLETLLTDRHGFVRRHACQAIAHRGQTVPAEKLVALLGDPDRFDAFAARRALEKVPAEQWQSLVLSTPSSRVFLQGATGLLVAAPSKPLALEVIGRCEAMLRGEQLDPRGTGRLTQEEYLDVLRVLQLALLRGQIQPAEAPSLAAELMKEYPTAETAPNHELVKLLAYLGPPEAPAAFAAQLASDAPLMEKLQLAAYAPRLRNGWQTDQKLAFLRYFETIRDEVEGGYSLDAYVENFARDFFTNLSLPERRQVLAAGERFPTSALSVLAKLPDDTSADVLAEVRALDGRLADKNGDLFDRLRVGIVATLGRFNDLESQAYLHKIYETQPERRAPVAMSLTQHPQGENWNLLVDSLRSIDGIAAGDVLHALTQVPQRPDSAEVYRHAILLGLRMGEGDGELASKLLAHWTGIPAAQGDLKQQLAAWQSWYTQTFPDAPAAELPKESTPSKWSFEELLSFLESEEGLSGNPQRGAKLFTSAQCVKCHRMRGEGERLGPDLTTVASRFQKKEILESIVYPSHVVSDQYASRAVVANGRTYVGIAVRDGANGVVVLTANGEKVRLAEDEVEEVRSVETSAMPEGLLNPLTLEQVADLFAYLMVSSQTSVAETRGQSRR